MNRINQSLTAQQLENRLVKGHEIYINGLVEPSKDQKNLYIVKAKYFIEDLTTSEDIEPYFKCSCPDHQFRQVQCYHIKAVEFYLASIGADQ